MKPTKSASKFPDPARTALDGGGWFKVPNALISHLMTTLSPTEVFVWLAMRRHDRTGDGTVCVGAGRIAADLGSDERNVKRSIAILTQKGFLETLDAGGGNVPARRRLCIPAPVVKSTTGDNAAPVVEVTTPPVVNSATPPMVEVTTAPVVKVTTHIRLDKTSSDCKQDERLFAAGPQGDHSKSTKAKKPPDTTLPPTLDTPAFRATWAEWQTHLKQSRHPLTPLAAQRQLKALAEVGETEARARIENAIGKGWRFPYEIKDHQNGKAARGGDPWKSIEPEYTDVHTDAEIRVACGAADDEPVVRDSIPQVKGAHNGKTREFTEPAGNIPRL